MWEGIQENRPPVWKHLPQLSLEERDRRWEEIRWRMVLWDLDCLLIFGDDFIEYVSSIASNANVVIFPIEGEPIAYYAHRPFDWQWDYGVGQIWVKNCRVISEGLIAQDVIQTLKELGFTSPGAHIGVVGQKGSKYRMSSTTPAMASVIKQALPEATFMNATPILEELRLIKSPEEIKFLEKAGEIAYAMFEACVKTMETPGARECDIAAAMLNASLVNGGRLTTGTRVWLPMLDVGKYPLMHAKERPVYTTRKIEKGDIAIMEWHSGYGGYTTANEHSYSLGEPVKEYRDIADVTEECFKRGFEACKPGNTLSKVVEAFRTPCYEAGMAYVELGIHGHGLYTSELPAYVYPPPEEQYRLNVSLHGKKPPSQLPSPAAESIRMKPGMVFGTNIDVYNPKWRESTLMLGDTILITETGAKKLTPIPTEFTIIKYKE